MRRPLVWFAAAFAVGIALSRWTLVSMVGWLAVAGAACALALISLRAGRSSSVLLLAASCAAGGLWSSLDRAAAVDDPFAGMLGRPVTVEGWVVRPPQVLIREGAATRTRLAVAVDRTEPPPAGGARGTVLVTVAGRRAFAYGDRIRARGRLYRPPPAGNPGEVSYRDYLRSVGIDAAMAVQRASDIRVVARGGGHLILAAAYGLRARLTAFMQGSLPGAEGALLSSLLLGDDGAIAPGLRETFRSAGLLHVLVVSGAQVALVVGSILWLGRLVRAPPQPAAAAAAGAVAFFALMTGWVPSVGRATVMALVGIAALLLRRDRDAYTALAMAALVLLVAQPALVADLGFQLSFAATWGLLYVAPALAGRIPAGPPALRSLIGMTVGAQMAVLPLLAYHAGRISLAGFVANLIVVPIVGLLVPVGFAAAAIGLAAPALGGAALAVLRPVLALLMSTAEVFAHLPGATVMVVPPGLPVLAAAYAGLAVATEALRGTVRVTPPRAVTALCAVAAVVLWMQVAAASPGDLVITVLDVGQGDSILVQSPGGAAMLIDGGGDLDGRPSGYDVGAHRVVPALRRLGVRALDVVVLSHPHEDHAGGLVAVLKNFRVDLVLDAGVPHPAPSYVALLKEIERSHIPYRLARRGMHLDLGDGVSVTVLHPEEPLLLGTGSDPHLNCIVLRVAYGDITVLLTGDIEAPIEWKLLDGGDDLRSTVLKVGHHGSETSTTPEFLDAVRPAVAVISVGAWNPFGHPRRRTLDALDAAGAAVFRTDRHGAISLTTDGRRLWVRTGHDASDR
jgi:competence protein ComEC